MARPLPDPVLFLDECLGTTDVPAALRKVGVRVELLHETFPRATRDEDWLAKVGERGWVVLTKDQRILRRQVEFSALLAANVAAFVLTSGNLTGAETAAAFVRAYPRMRKVLRDFEVPFVASVKRNGSVSLLNQAARRAEQKRGR